MRQILVLAMVTLLAAACGDDTAADDDCGNNVCEAGEDSATCPEDCPPATCGDCVCDPGEGPANCPADCSSHSCLGQSCPGTGTCYDGVCIQGLPDCMDPTHPDFQSWPDDSDLEPNGTPALAVTLPCGDDGVVIDPAEYYSRCPTRDNYPNGFINLAICPAGEHDLYGLYLLAGDVMTAKIMYLYDPATNHFDIDLTVWWWDDANQQAVEVATADTTTHNDDLSITAQQEGWYYLDVYGKCQPDINNYTIMYLLNPASP
jgi:hypothetical protein